MKLEHKPIVRGNGNLLLFSLLIFWDSASNFSTLGKMEDHFVAESMTVPWYDDHFC